MSQPRPEPDEIEYVGAPTEFADAQEVPDWVADIARILFFLPAAFLTATTIPIILIGLVLVCCMFFGLLIALY